MPERRRSSERRDDRGPRTARRPEPRPTPREPDALLARQNWSGVRAVLPDADESVFVRLRAYSKLLLGWSQGVSNLISRHDEQRFVERHLFESLAIAGIIRDSGAKQFVDFGSGGGLPALPLCIAGIGEHWTLVESRRNKTLFLRKVQQDLELRHIDVVTDRLENVVEAGELVGAFDGFTSRATATMEPTLTLAAQLVRPGGHAFLWKGSSHEAELAEASDALTTSWRLEAVHPIGAGPNVVCVFIIL